MPDRIEAVIAERIQRLPEVCQEILAAASVEGEEFIAEVAAKTLGLTTGEVIHHLSGSISKIHRLVAARGQLHIGEHTYAKYQFRHSLFQRYLYHCLDPVKRANLHIAVGNALEHFYNIGKVETNPNWKTTVIQLAKHFELAGLEEKAVEYLLLAADLARELQSHHEAIDYFQRALQIQKSRKDYEGAARTLIKLGLTHHTIFEFSQASKAFDEGNILYQHANRVTIVNVSTASHALRIDWEALSTFDPALSNDIASAEVNNQLFSGLLLLKFDGDLVPDVASSWDVSDDGRRYVFKLREGLRWSDGTLVTAMDFEYAWKRVLNPATGSPCASLFYCIQGAAEYHQAISGATDQVGIRTINPILLQVDLTTPTSFFPYLLALPAFKPVPHHIVENYGETWTSPQKIQSNGPFRLQDWKEGRIARFERNPCYQGDFQGNLEEVELYIIPDWHDRLKMYEEGELDVQDLTWFPPREAEHLRLTHADGYISKPYLFTGYIGFNVSHAPFDDVRVRQAFGLALDKDILANVVGRSHFPPANGGLVPPGIPGHVEGIGLPYNPQKARRLLAEAGYPEGHGFPSLNFVIPQGAIIVDLDFVRSQWQKNLGLTFEFEILDFLTMCQRLANSPPQLYAFSYVADYPDPDSFLRSSFCLSATRWQNPVFDILVNEAVKTTENDERMKLYQQAENILVEESPLLPIIYGRQHLLLKPWVKRYPTSTSRSIHWKDIVMSRD
jgi:ABC-type oligopeptide transport system substrate-binding subunit